MPSILDRIFDAKRAEVAERRARTPLDEMVAEARGAAAPRDFIGSLRSRAPAIIAEVKRASPSKGDIFPGLDPAAVARDYAAAGAAAISVLTDRHFKGSLEDLRAVRAAAALPILRKDFIFDAWQIYEARAAGADCILMIAAMLEAAQLRSLAALARDLGMAVLVEAHDRREFEMANAAGAALIGINNRDLHTFRTDLATTETLLADYRGAALIVAESGIETPADLRRLYAAGSRAFLIGEGLLRAGAPRAALAALIGGFGAAAEAPAR